jgi:hypothetical protein
VVPAPGREAPRGRSGRTCPPRAGAVRGPSAARDSRPLLPL